MNELISTTNDVAMTSRDLAELTGKDHFNVMRDIIKEMESLGEKGEIIFELAKYADSQGKQRSQYTFGKKGAMQLALKYDAVTRYKVIEKIEELESKAKFQVPTALPEALRLAAKIGTH